MLGFEEMLLLFGVGLVAGFFAGLIGIGGGLFYVLIFSFFLDRMGIVNEQEFVRLVIANSLLATFFAALSASIKHIKLNNFYPKQILQIGIPGLLASILITYGLSQVSFYNKGVFAVVFSIALIPLIVKMLAKPKQEYNVPLEQVSRPKFMGVGILGGAAAALSGLGGSFVMTPILNTIYKISIRKVVSLAVGVIVIVSGATSIYNFLFPSLETTGLEHTYGSIILPMTVPLVLGVMLAAPFGVKISLKTSPRLIRIIFALFCIAVMLRNFKEMLTSWNII